MPELNATRHDLSHSRRQALIISLGLAFGLLLAACPLSMVAVQQRVIQPPVFALRLGSVEIAAPCPVRFSVCDSSTPWYAIWRSDHRPDGSFQSRQLFFMYLKPAQRQ
jgi:hypothetical protein